MTEEIKVPEMSESTVEATVGIWHKQVGDTVKEGDPADKGGAGRAEAEGARRHLKPARGGGGQADR